MKSFAWLLPAPTLLCPRNALHMIHPGCAALLSPFLEAKTTCKAQQNTWGHLAGLHNSLAGRSSYMVAPHTVDCGQLRQTLLTSLPTGINGR